MTWDPALPFGPPRPTREEIADELRQSMTAWGAAPALIESVLSEWVTVAKVYGYELGRGWDVLGEGGRLLYRVVPGSPIAMSPGIGGGYAFEPTMRQTFPPLPVPE